MYPNGVHRNYCQLLLVERAIIIIIIDMHWRRGLIVADSVRFRTMSSTAKLRRPQCLMMGVGGGGGGDGRAATTSSVDQKPPVLKLCITIVVSSARGA